MQQTELFITFACSALAFCPRTASWYHHHHHRRQQQHRHRIKGVQEEECGRYNIKRIHGSVIGQSAFRWWMVAEVNARIRRKGELSVEWKKSVLYVLCLPEIQASNLMQPLCNINQCLNCAVERLFRQCQTDSVSRGENRICQDKVSIALIYGHFKAFWGR